MMKNPFRYFDKVFVISAKNNRERRQYVKEILSKLNITAEFFDAVIGEELSDEEIRAVYDEGKAIKHKTNKRPLSKPELGCALSHINIYKKIVAEDLDNALIFEDDIVPDYELLNKINDAVDELPSNWDLLQLGTLDHYKKPPLSFQLKLLFYYPLVKFFAPQKIAYKYWHLWNFYPRHYSKTLNRSGYHLGCQAYAMNRSGAEKFLAYHDKIVTPVDNMISVMVVEDELNAFMTKEMVFDQNKDLESAIENSRLIIRDSLKENRSTK